MAAEVSSLVRGLNGYKVDDRKVVGGEPASAAAAAALITRDLLGGAVGDGSENNNNNNNPFQELDLDVQVPTGWEKRLDLKSGKVYLHRCSNSPASPSSSPDHRHRHQHHHHHHHRYNNQTFPQLQDLNFPPSPSRITLNLFDEGSLDLKLAAAAAAAATPPSTSGSSSLNYYQSVCTLDKVKSALERAEKEPLARKRHPTAPFGLSSMSPPSYSSSASSIRESAAGDDHGTEERGAGTASPVAAGCPGCLSYVLIMKNNPKCPRCNSLVPTPAMKKPRIDLNISI